MQYNVRAAGLSPAALFVSNYAKTRRDTLISRPIKGKITMENKKKRIVIALGGNALGNTLPEQMKAVKIHSQSHRRPHRGRLRSYRSPWQRPSGRHDQQCHGCAEPRRRKPAQHPLSVCVAMSQAYIGYDLQNALREELYNREMYDIPVATMITQVRRCRRSCL